MNAMVWTVGGLCKAVADALAARFDSVRVRGEISGFAQASSGHCYFALKDAQGQLKCAMFRRAASQLGRLPKNGDQVEVLGRIGVYESRGDLQLVVESLQPLGQGALFEEYLRLKSKLEAEGLFDVLHKRALPRSPRRIGLVTSLGAAALHDVATALKRRVPHIPVVLAPALVQGQGAAASLKQALQSLYTVPDLDVILMVRGGGSIEDLWSFNDESLVRWVRQSPVPLVCGVGHETDFTLCDFAADVRAPTPTAAAELCAVPMQDWLNLLMAQTQRTIESVQVQLDRQVQHLDRLQQAIGRPQAGLGQQSKLLSLFAWRASRAVQSAPAQHKQRLDESTRRWMQWTQSALLSQRHRLQTCQVQLEAMNPRHVIDRGYSWITDAKGQALTRVQQFSKGQQVKAILSDGEVQMTVDDPRLHG
jgi:exodeoxyribonuclease VII large subunit